MGFAMAGPVNTVSYSRVFRLHDRVRASPVEHHVRRNNCQLNQGLNNQADIN